MGSHLEDPAGNVDRLLVERCRAGDANAFGDLYKRHYARLYRFVRARVSQSCVAEDVTQEAFARAMVALEGLRNPNRFYPWLTVIARHLVANHHRSTAMLCHVSDLDAPSTADAPDAEILRLEEHQDVRIALERVRRRHREILTMRERDELSYEDMARLLGTPSTTIPPLLWRARAAFRREYLAVTGEERKLLGIAPLFEAVRRMRNRLAQSLAGVPDATIFLGSATVATTVALGLASMLGQDGSITLEPRVVTLDEARSQVAAGSALPVDTMSGTSDPIPDPPANSSGIAFRSEVGELGLDQRGADEARERARDWPVVLDPGPVGIAVNPDPLWEDLLSASP